MLEPNGPLPQSVYWRRRGLAAGVSVLAVVLLAWIIGGLVEADDQHPVQGTANAAGPGDPAATGTATSDRTSAPPSSPGPDDPRGSVTASPSSSGPTSATPAPAPTVTTPTTPTTTTAPPAPPAAAPTR